jgi:hypothetical protein
MLTRNPGLLTIAGAVTVLIVGVRCLWADYFDRWF